MRPSIPIRAAAVSLLCLLATAPVEAADAVVGPPCDKPAFSTALATVQASTGGTVTFDCGSGAVIPITSACLHTCGHETRGNRLLRAASIYCAGGWV